MYFLALPLHGLGYRPHNSGTVQSNRTALYTSEEADLNMYTRSHPS